MHLMMFQMFFKVKSVNNLNNVGRLDVVGNLSQMVSCGQMVDDCVQIIWYDLFLLRKVQCLFYIGIRVYATLRVMLIPRLPTL